MSEVIDVPAVVTHHDSFVDFVNPERGTARMAELATEVRHVIDAKGWAVAIPGARKPHLVVEAWQYIGQRAGITTQTEWCRDVRDPQSGALDGTEARVRCIRVATGADVGGAEQACFADEMTEKKWEWVNGQKRRMAQPEYLHRWLTGCTGHAKATPASACAGIPNRHAIRGMAQTRAQSRALASVVRFIAEMAGYSGTPREEMPDELPSADRPQQPSPQRAASRPQPGRREEPQRALVGNAISEAQARRIVAIARTVGEKHGEHGFHVVASVLKAAGLEPFPPKAKMEDALLHLCEYVEPAAYDDFVTQIEGWAPDA